VKVDNDKDYRPFFPSLLSVECVPIFMPWKFGKYHLHVHGTKHESYNREAGDNISD
jgi:hypothetical protein